MRISLGSLIAVMLMAVPLRLARAVAVERGR